MMHMSGLLKTVRARDELHRASMRLIAKGAGMRDAARTARSPRELPQAGGRTKLDAVKLIK
jgi:hypothetical protein